MDNDIIKKLRDEKIRLSYGFASVADLIDYKLVDSWCRTFAPGFRFPRKFRILGPPLSHLPRAASLRCSPCFSADKLNRSFYFEPRYILTVLRSRRLLLCFFLSLPSFSATSFAPWHHSTLYEPPVYPIPTLPLIAAEQIPCNQFSARLSLAIRYFIVAEAECTAKVIRFSLHSSESSTNSYALRDNAIRPYLDDNAIICMLSVCAMIIGSISW